MGKNKLNLCGEIDQLVVHIDFAHKRLSEAKQTKERGAKLRVKMFNN